jgi:hypothetical protein
MKTRAALFFATLLLLTGVAFASDPEQLTRPGARAIDDEPSVREPRERATRTLKVPYIFDGVQFPAATPLPDRSLTFVLSPEDIAKGTIHVFSFPDVAKTFMDRDLQATKGVTTDALGNRGISTNLDCTWTEEYSWFNTAVGCGNPGVLTLYPFGQYSNLDFGGWNNTISCVKAACIGYYTVIYACRNFQTYVDGSCADPDALYIPPGFVITDLNNYGFNNRTSSIRFE